MDLGLAGKTALVTGGASGIGKATVDALSAEGAHVVVLDLAPDDGGEGTRVQGDVTRQEDVARAVAVCGERHGGLDVVVGCAGISGPIGRTAEVTPLADWERTLAVNLTGQFLLAKHTIPALRARSGGSIVFVASDSSFVAAPGMTAYCASKGGVLMLCRALSADHAAEGIRVNCVCPSIVDTPMSRADLGLPAAGGFGEVGYPVHRPEDVARAILFLSSGAAGTINGTALVTDFGGLARSSFPA